MILKVGKEGTEPIVNMWLQECSGQIEVRAKSTNRTGIYTIMVFGLDGKFWRAGCVPDNLGFIVSTIKGEIQERER